MPCIFCVAVFMTLAGAVTAATIDQMEHQLEGKTATPIKRVVDTSSVTKLEFSMAAAGKSIPVAVTVLKDSMRVRIQLLSHDLDKDDADKLQNQLGELLDLKIVERSNPASEAKVHEVFDHDHRHKDVPESVPAPAAGGIRSRLGFLRRR